jgi:hypothetical protein
MAAPQRAVDKDAVGLMRLASHPSTATAREVAFKGMSASFAANAEGASRRRAP